MLEINIPEVVAEVTETFMAYERALIANDVAALDKLFWDSPLTLRYGVGENLYGHKAIAAFRIGRPVIDMTRRLINAVITTYGRDAATANTEFQRVGGHDDRPAEPCLATHGAGLADRGRSRRVSCRRKAKYRTRRRRPRRGSRTSAISLGLSGDGRERSLPAQLSHNPARPRIDV